MENSKQQTERLIDAYLAGEATAEERNQLERLYANAALNAEYVDDLEIDQLYQLKKESLLKVIAEIRKEKIKRLTIVKRIVAMAAAVAAITLGVWLYNIFNTSRHPELVSGSPLANDIAPGKNTATIKIGDGEAITLSDQQTGVIVGEDLRYNDGSALQGVNAKAEILKQVQDDAGGKRVTVTTPRGGTYQVTLPDGTKVWLNAASSLTYTMPLKERGGIRKVQLSGEAYFEVFRNKNQPFVVATKNLTTTVLGTHFNISAYDDENTARATLLEGSVRVANTPRHPELGSGPPPGKTAMRDVTLKPNQQAAVAGNANINVKQVDAAEAVAWKEGLFNFANEDIKSVMRKVSRWYNVDVKYVGNVAHKGIGGVVSRYENVSQVLDMLRATKAVNCKLEGKTIIISPYQKE